MWFISFIFLVHINYLYIFDPSFRRKTNIETKYILNDFKKNS